MTAPPGVVPSGVDDAAVIQRSRHEPDQFAVIYDRYVRAPPRSAADHEKVLRGGARSTGGALSRCG